MSPTTAEYATQSEAAQEGEQAGSAKPELQPVVYALQAFVDYYTQAGIGECVESHDDDDFGDGFDGDERFNVRQGRKALNSYRRAAQPPTLDPERPQLPKPLNEDFYNDLTALINKYSRENQSNTPDFILAAYIEGCLNMFAAAVNRREDWYGRAK